MRELSAPRQILDNEVELANRLWQALTHDGGAADLEWPEDVRAVARELFLPAKRAVPEAVLRAIGRSPSRLSETDPAAKAQRDAGYEVTDYAGLFSGAGPFLAGQLPGATLLRDAPEVVFAGEMLIMSSRLVTIDFLDHVWLDRNVQRLDRDVRRGYSPVYVARWGDAIAAALVLFGPAPVRAWAPARPDAERSPMPIPPVLPMSMVRYSIGVCDEATFTELMASVAELPALLAARAAERAQRGQGPVGPEEILSRAARDKVPMTFVSLEDHVRGPARHGIVSDVLGLAADGPVASHWGLDEQDNVVAYAIDFGRLRLFPSAAPDAISRPAPLLEAESLTLRLAHAAGGAPASEALAEQARELARAIPGWRAAGQTDRLVAALARLG